MVKPVRSGLFALFGALILPAVALAQEGPRVETVPECLASLPENVAANGGFDCGYVVVRQNRSKESEGEIRIAYMRIRAAEKASAPPLFMLAGGPGQTIIQDETLLLFQPEFLGPILEDRDVVLMEQRGTFRSKPKLDCPEAHSAGFDALRDGLDARAAEALELGRVRACIMRHEQAGVDFAAYNNVENAADVDDVRAALGYDTIVFYGGSYGTLLGQYFMRQFPDRLAAAILDGTDGLSGRSWIENRALNAQWGIDNLTRLCAAQPGCAEAFDIPTLLQTAFDLFDEGPIAVTVPLAAGSPDSFEVEATVTAQDLAQFVYSMQTSKYGVAALPAELEQLIAGGRILIGKTLGEQGAAVAEAERMDTEIGMMTLMHAAMVCSDDPARSFDEIKTEGTGRYAKLFAQSAGGEYVDLCSVMEVPQLPDSLDADVETDVPTLILSGGLDVQTPYFLSEEVAQHLPRATHVIFPAGFHVQIFNINRCAMKVLQSFLRDPETEPDLSCVSKEQPLPFVLLEAQEDKPE